MQWRRLLQTNEQVSTTLLRVALGVIMWPHGAQHLLGWFGGFGFAGTVEWMTGTLGIPAPVAALAIVTEFLAPLALIVGLGGRLAALGIAGVITGAMITHLPNGFFMNWFGSLPAGAEGFEYHLLVLVMSLALVLQGSGSLSIDRLIQRQRAYLPDLSFE
jgi:putative oxidoreductase